MLDEKEICALLVQQPEKGLAELMDQYTAFVYTIAYGKLSNACTKQDIEECVSDIFYEIYRTRNIIDLEKGSLKSYIAVISKRRAIDFFRKQQRAITCVSSEKFEHDLIASDTDVEKDVIDRETSNILIREIKLLGEPDSDIMIRRYYFVQNTKTIAKALGMKENTVSKRVSRALDKLERVLGDIL